MAKYQIFTDSSCDLSTDIREANNIAYFYFGLVVDGKEYPADLDWKAYSPEEFYGWLSAGKKVKTTQVSMEEVVNKVRPLFEQGIDVIYLGCSSALTGSMNLFELAKTELMEEFPDRKMIGVDTLAAACTLGMMVVDAAKKQQEGLSIEELQQWVLDNRFFYNQFATVDTLTYLKAAGRIKGTAAFFGNIISLKPILVFDEKGSNVAVEKAIGKKKAFNRMAEMIRDDIVDPENQEIYLMNADCNPEDVEYFKNAILKEVNVKNIAVETLGPVIGASSGPGTIIVNYKGK